MKTLHCFGPRYDVGRLLADLESAEKAGQFHKHWTDYHDGGWSAIPLVSLGGAVDADSLKHGRGDYRKTPILAQCPYFEEIIESFHCPKERIRLMRLEPGKKILKHTDPGDAWALGKVRLHVPVVTHEEVYFYLDGERVVMRPGELWHCDFSRPHWIENRGPVARVHFVLDLVVNRWMRDFFPPETLADRVYNAAYWCRFHGKEVARGVAEATGAARLRRALRRRAAGAGV